MPHEHDKESHNYTDQFVTDDPASNLGILAAKIAYHNFELRYVTIVMFSTIQAIGLNTFLMNYQQTVVVKLGRFLPQHRVAVPQFVIFGKDSSEITSTLRWIIRSKYDGNAKFIIVCAFSNQDCDEQKIFKTLEKLYILNVVLLKSSHKTNKTVAYSYQIVSEAKCKSNLPYKINLFVNCNNDECFKGLFPAKLTNFYKCRLVMSTVEQPPFMYLHNGTRSPSGIDGDIMKLTAEMLNATLFLTTPVDGSDAGRYTNNNWTGSLGDIYNEGSRHASVCSVPLSSNKYGNFQISFTYYSMDIVWATRLPIQKASWVKLLYPLNFHVRIILLFIFIGIIVMNTFCRTRMWREVRKAFKIESPKHSLLFYSWIIFLGMPILRTPVRRSFIVTVYTWIWFCFIIRSAYQAVLIHSMKQPAYHDNLGTFGDILKDRHPYGGSALLKEYYYDDRTIYENWVDVNSSSLFDILDDILDGTTDFVLASNKEIIKHHVMKYNGSKQLQIIPEKIVNSPTVVYFKKYSHLTAPVSYALQVAFEAGFIHRTFEKYLDRDKKLLQRHRSQPEPLKMQHFTGCFVILIIGWLIAVTFFAVEYVCGNLNDE